MPERYHFTPEVHRPRAVNMGDVFQRVGELAAERNWLEASSRIEPDPVIARLHADLVRSLTNQIEAYHGKLLGRSR